MCGRFFLADSDNSGELCSIIDQLNRRGVTVKTGEIFPTDTVPVLANNRNRRVVPFPMQWGYTLPCRTAACSSTHGAKRQGRRRSFRTQCASTAA